MQDIVLYAVYMRMHNLRFVYNERVRVLGWLGTQLYAPRAQRAHPANVLSCKQGKTEKKHKVLARIGLHFDTVEYTVETRHRLHFTTPKMLNLVRICALGRCTNRTKFGIF